MIKIKKKTKLKHSLVDNSDFYFSTAIKASPETASNKCCSGAYKVFHSARKLSTSATLQDNKTKRNATHTELTN